LRPKPGDHICTFYTTASEMSRKAAAFLADGLGRGERCWYVASSDEGDAVRAALAALDVDVDAQIRRGALGLVSRTAAYIVDDAFDPEATLRAFNDAIEQACADGYTGFRAAADMTWALDCEDGPYQLIVYEALLKSLFSNCRATGLCLYDRGRMPLGVINGALETHPLFVDSTGDLVSNDFYDPTAARLQPVEDAVVFAKLSSLNEHRQS